MAMKQVCGAWAKSRGRACQRPALSNGRCPNHGGRSSGPITARGAVRGLRNLWHYRKRPVDELAMILLRQLRPKFPDLTADQVREALES